MSPRVWQSRQRGQTTPPLLDIWAYHLSVWDFYGPYGGLSRHAGTPSIGWSISAIQRFRYHVAMTQNLGDYSVCALQMQIFLPFDYASVR